MKLRHKIRYRLVTRLPEVKALMAFNRKLLNGEFPCPAQPPELISELASRVIDQDDLDDFILSQLEEDACNINNSGVQGQIEFLLGRIGEQGVIEYLNNVSGENHD
jgi:hypothetical protein